MSKTLSKNQLVARTKRFKLRNRIARVLDATYGEQSPQIYQARQQLAAWLDGIGPLRRTDLRWLEKLYPDERA